jgi:hypothetical protein
LSVIPCRVFGAICQSATCSAPTPTITGCSKVVCYESNNFYSCQTCANGYNIKSGNTQNTGSCTFIYQDCEINCNGCENCISDTNWVAHATGYEKKVDRNCDCNTCNTTGTSYRCAADYYGTSTNGSTGCTACPESKSSAAGATAITSCYIPAGTTDEDTIGNYTYTSDCYYSNIILVDDDVKPWKP